MRHLIEKLDGGTTGPNAFSGPIGSSLTGCEELTIIKYVPVELNNCPNLDGIELSTDQKYLYEICQAISSGEFPATLALQKPGPVVHSRWLTTANRILRLYASSDCPSVNLVHLTTYIMKVYAPMWFNIKTKPFCMDGTRHLWMLIRLTRYLEPELRNVVDAVIQRNGYFGHPENILLAMLTDTRQYVRELACRRIISARNECSSSKAVRKFCIPKLNFDARDYIDIVRWQDIDRHEPPLLKNVADNVLKESVKSKSFDNLQIPRFPCHTQGTEWCIRLVTQASATVTQASATVCGDERRDGFIRARLKSRNMMKKFESKFQFKL